MKRKKPQNNKKSSKRFAPNGEVSGTPEITSNELFQSSGSFENVNLTLSVTSDVTTSSEIAVKSTEPTTVNEQPETSHLLENVQFKKPKRNNTKPIKNRISGGNVLKPTLNELFQNNSLLNNVKQKKPQKRNVKQSRSKASSGNVVQFLEQTTVNDFFQSSLFGNQLNQSQKAGAKPQNKRSSNAKVPKRIDQAIREPIADNVLVANTKQKRPQKPRKKQPNSVQNVKPVIPSFKLPKLTGIDISLVPTSIKTPKQKVKPLKSLIAKLPKLSGVDISLVPSNTKTSRPSVKSQKSFNVKPPKLSGVNISLVPSAVKTPRQNLKPSRQYLKPPRQNLRPPQHFNVKSPNLSDVNISLVPKGNKTPRRNVKPPKKYADQDFIYYNKSEPDDCGVSPTLQTTSEECGINPALLCECTLETSDASVSGHKRSVSTVSGDGDASSENIECAPDVSSLCDTSLVGPDASANRDKLQVSTSNTDTASEFEDDLPDLSNLCETVLITADPADAPADNGQSVDSSQGTAVDDGHNAVGVSSMCESEVITPDLVSVSSPCKQSSSAVAGDNLEVGSEDGLVDPSVMYETQLITSDPVEAPPAMNQLPVAGSSEEEFILGLNDELDFASLRPKEVKDLQKHSELKKEVSVRKTKKNKEPKKRSKKKKRSKSGSTRKKSKRKEKAHIENITKVLTEIQPTNTDEKHESQVEDQVFQGNSDLDQLPVQCISTDKSENDHLPSEDEEKPISKNDKESMSLLEDKLVDDSSEDKMATVVEKKVSDHDEENWFKLDENKEIAVPEKDTVLSFQKCEDSKEEKLDLLDYKSSTESNQEKPCALEVKETEPNEGDSYPIDDKPKQLVDGARNIDECSVPDSDSGCDVDMEQGCEDYESPGGSRCVKEETPAVDQVPSFNETRIVKVSLHRLEDEEYFSTWKEEKKLPKSLTNTVDTESVVDDSGNKESPTEPVLTVSKPKKSKRSRRATWDSIFKRKSFVKCTNCSKKFPNESMMKKHRGSHTCVVMVRCRRCFAKFKNVERYLEHKKSNCDTERVFACNVCGKSYALKLHLERHQNPICGLLRATTCEVCKLQCESRESLRRHQHRAHGTGPHSREYLCEFCGALLTSKDKFLVHKESHVDLHCLCKECGKEFRSNRRLRDHMKIHTKNDGERSSKASVFTCAECGESFSILSKLKVHLTKHGMVTALKSFECKICHKGFDKRENLSRHLRVHREKKDNICSNCNVSFNSFTDLKQHMTVCCVKLSLKIKSEDNLSIKEEKPYVCHVCGMSFRKSNHLKQHSVVHLYNKPLSTCEICGKTFKSKFYLDQHILMVSCNVSSTNYCCKGCGNEYSTFPTLKMHFVEAHDVKPLGKAPIKCDKCQSEFDEMYKLKRHSKIHKEGYWTSCNHCGKVITQRSLKSHMLAAHKIQPDNDVSSVKVEPLEAPVIKVEEEPNLSSEVSNQNIIFKSNESAKPKLPSTNHGDKNLLPCRFCGKILGSRRSLTRHILNVHKSSSISESSSSSTVLKTVPQCVKMEDNSPVPQETFLTTPATVSNESSIQRQTTEIKQVSVPCNICGKCLSSSRSLKRHMIACHKESVNNNTSISRSKTNHTFSNENNQQFSHTNNDDNSFSQRYENVKVDISEPLHSSDGVNICSESQMPTSIPNVEKSTLQSDQVYRSVQSSTDLRLQTEQQVHDTPTSTQSQDYDTPDISKDGILMSQLINAKNYKMYLPNTSFINSQSQNVEASVRRNVPSNQEITSSYSMRIPSEAQQNQYPSPTNNPISVPVTYLSHGSSSTSFNSSTSCYSNPVTSYVSNSTISSSDQYINSTPNLHIPSLLDDKQLDIIEHMISTPPPVQAQVNATSSTVSFQQTLTPQYQNDDVPDSSSKYFLDPNYPALSKALTYPSSVTTEHTQTLPGQINEMNGNNFQLVHQEAPVGTPSNPYMLHQYVQPNTSHSLTQMSYSNPGTTKTYIIVQPELKSETVSKPQIALPLNGYTKRVENWTLQTNKNENQHRVLRVVCNLCKQSFDSKEDLNKHLIVHGLEYTTTHYRCTTCNHLFDVKYKYRAEEHLRIHSGEKPFSCKQCPQKFRTSSLLSRHLQTTHKPAEKCSMCHVTLSSAYNLRRHMKSVHKIEDPPTQQTPEPVKEERPPSTQQATELVKKEPSASLLEMDFGPFQYQEKLANQSEPEPAADSQPNYQESFTSQEMPHFRRNEELSSNPFMYNFEAPSSSRSDVALDLSDMRDDYVPDAMETVLKLEHW